jgi:hypothetical protein
LPKTKSEPPPSTPEQAQAPELVAQPSPGVLLLFLKHASLESEWTSQDLASALGIDGTLAKQITGELAMVGYAEPVPKKRDSWRNTATGNRVTHVKPPRLTRGKAEQLLKEVIERAKAFNLETNQPLRIAKIVAFGGINTQHERIQDIDLGVRLETKLGHENTHADVENALKALRGRSPSLKMHSIDGWPPRMGRIVWER